MFTAEVDAGLAVHEPYPTGEAGIQKSLAVICKKVREGSSTAAMKSYAGNVLREAGFPKTAAARAAAMLDHVRRNVAYAHDAMGTEMIQSAMVSLCVDGAPICIPIGDCDDLVTALATLCGAAGMDVVVVRQFFGDGHQQHVLCEVKLENGKWFPLDPSSSTMPAGQKAKAVRETRSSPWDESITGLSSAAEFVGIGALPVFLYGRDGWAEVRDFDASGLGAEPDRWAEVGQNVQVPLPPGKVVLWEGGWWYRDPATGVAYQWSEPRRGCSSCGTGALATVGTGALLDDMTAALKFSMDPIALIKQFWSRIQGRSWDQALTSAHGRAIAGNWPAGDQAAREDLITLIVSSAMNMKLLRDKDDVIAADNLGRTWVILADRMGIKNPTPGELAHMKQQGSLTGLAEMYVVLIAAIGIIMQGIVTMGIIVALLYFASQVIDDVLSKIVCERELMRIHAEYNKVIDKRLAGGGSSADEKDIADKLDAQQRYVAAGCTKPKPGFDWWPLAIGASIVGVTILGVAYAPEIKQLLGKKSAA